MAIMVPGGMLVARAGVARHGQHGQGARRIQHASMSLETAEVVAFLLKTYAALGLAFAGAFLPFGAHRVDSGLAGSPIAVRALILPGVVAFWPLFACRWARA
jgi:hypothetical protein